MERGVFGEEFGEGVPAFGVKGLKGVEVGGEEELVVAGAQGVDDRGEGLAGGGLGKVFDGAVFVVRDAEAVEEVAEQVFVCAHEPGLEKVGSEALVGFTPEFVGHPEMAVCAGFAFEENGAQVVGFGEGIEGSPVNRPLMLVEVGEDF